MNWLPIYAFYLKVCIQFLFTYELNLSNRAKTCSNRETNPDLWLKGLAYFFAQSEIVNSFDNFNNQFQCVKIIVIFLFV